MAPYDSCIYPVWRGAIDAYRSLPLEMWGLVGVALLLMVGGLRRWPANWIGRRIVPWLALLAVISGSIWYSIHLSWVSSEALVTLRYADHLAAGAGLVFNEGERTAGYSSLLGVLIAAPLRTVGLSAHQLVTSVGTASLALTLLASHWLARRQSPEATRGGFTLTPLLLGGSATFVGFASGDVDVMLGTGLLLWALEQADRGRAVNAGALAGLAALCGSDYWLLGLALAAAQLGLRPWAALGRQLGTMALVVAPATAFSWWYFGNPIPERFYAWSGASWYGGQGTVYALWSLFDSGVVLLIPALVLGHYAQRAEFLGRYLVVASGLHLLYVLMLGGDYILGRTLTPLLPVWILVAEAGLRFGWAARPFSSRRVALRILASAATVLAAGVVVPHPMLDSGEVQCRLERPPPWNVAEAQERTTAWRTVAQALERLSPVPHLALDDPERALATSAPVLFLPGPTHRSVARHPLHARGRVGNEKRATADVLLAAGVDVSESAVFPDPYASLSLARLEQHSLYLLQYRPDVAGALAPLAVTPIPTPEQLLANLNRPTDPATRQCHLWFIERYLLDPSPASDRSRLVAQLGLEDPIAEWLAAPASTDPPGWRHVSDLPLHQSSSAPWLQDGTAFEEWPVQEAAVNQGRMLPHSPFVNSYSATAGDGSRGVLQSPPFTIDGDVLSFEVAGGKDPARLRVELLVEDRTVAHTATGCNSELFRRVLWNVRSQRGKKVRLLIVDDSKDGWGHIMVANVRQFGVAP